MSQDYFPPSASSSAAEGSSQQNGHGQRSSDAHPPQNVPDYMVVGSGSTSESATSLMHSLNQDSGYGGSIAGDSSHLHEWHDGMMEDKPTTSRGQINTSGLVARAIQRFGRAVMSNRPFSSS